MKLSVGTLAPTFSIEDIFGHMLALGAYIGKPVLLSFYRNGACALCNWQIHRLIQAYPAYHQQGLEGLAVFESPRASVLQHVSKQDAPFSIIADPDARLYDLYGVESSEEKVMANPSTEKQTALIQEAQAIGYPLTHEAGSNFYRLPADFLIGPDQRLQMVFYSDVVGDHLPFDQIENYLHQLASMSQAAIPR